MRHRSIFRIMLPIAAIVCGFAAAASADLELGKVDEYKLKSFSEYFSQYFDVAKTEFDDKEFEVKLRGEAADINLWLADPANWPPENKIKPEMYADAGWIFFYFANAGLPGAHEQSMKYLEKASKSDPKNYVIPLKLARMAAAKGEGHLEEMIRFAEQAMAADPVAAAKENLHQLLAEAYYEQGYFAKAYKELKLQAETDESYGNTANLLFAWGLYVEQWGEIPERIVQKKQPDGAIRPEPADGE